MDAPDTGYSGGAVFLAAVVTVCVPLIAVVVALLLLSGETGPARRSQLRSWAWISGIWLVVAVTASVLLATLP